MKRKYEKEPNEILALKNKIHEIKTSLSGWNSILDNVEESVNFKEHRWKLLQLKNVEKKRWAGM